MSAERVCEFAGKLCYNAFGKNGSTKSNKEYLSHIYDLQHYSVLYHAHFSFYISGISRRLSHELLRHYIGVGASEGSPSQMSTRYVVHPARFVVHPRYLNHSPTGDFSYATAESDLKADSDNFAEYQDFKKSCKSAYRHYSKLIARSEGLKGLSKKRVLEAASMVLPQAVETSLVFTMNPISARKMFIERSGETADLEFKRLVDKMRSLCEQRYKSFVFR
jgi:thymidylate synthase (FAD)